MKEKIEKFSKGKFEYELPAIRLSEDRLSLTVACGKRLSGSVTTGNESGMHMKGIVYSDNPLVTVTDKQFVGCESIIEYNVNAEYAKVGDHITGELCFVTDCGEITLPFDFEVVFPVIMTMTGQIKDIKGFSELARDNYEEARRIFTSDDFEIFLKYHDPSAVLLRERLLRGPVIDNALEEFFVATRKKLPVSIKASKKELSYDVGFSSFSDTIKIKKSGWGYIALDVTSDNPCIEIERSSIRNEDFLGNEFELKFILYPDKMHKGINYANIKICGCGKEINVPVTIHVPSEDRETMANHAAESRLVIRLWENYLAYSMNQIPQGRYIAETNSIIDSMSKLPGADLLFVRLLRVSLMRLSGKESAAINALNGISEEELDGADVRTKTFYYYLMAEKAAEKKQDIIRRLYGLSEENDRDFFIELTLIALEDRFKKNIRLRLDEYRHLYEAGCHSPLLYMEAARILNDEPLLLKDVTEFETSVILFALKRNYCKRDLAAYYANLVVKQKGFVKSDLNALMAIYNKFQIEESLYAICQLLIRGHRKDAKYFKWYKKGVECNIRLADLYEYYMYSINKDIEDDLDQSVLMYYVYNSKLNDRRLSYLYANIVLHRDSNPIVYENYKEKLRIFAMGQLRAGRNDKNLAILYGDLLGDDNYRKQSLEHLGKVIFKHEVSCDNPNMRYVCVSHAELSEDVVVPLINGRAQIDIYTPDALVFVMDSSNNRYDPDETVTVTPLMDYDSLAASAFSSDRETPGLLINLGAKASRLRRYDQNGIDIRKQVIGLGGITEETKERYLSDLVLYFYDHAQDEIADDDLKRLKFKELNPLRRGKYIGLLILREQYTIAMKLMEECGFMEVDIKLLEKFATSLPQAVLSRENKTLLAIMHHLYANGRRNEKILIYLVSFYNGPTMDMIALWQVACLAQCATSEFDERIIGQILFTESYLPYAEQVYVHYHRRAKNRVLTKAYFNYLSYKYLISDVPVSPAVMEIFKRETYFERNDMVMLACLKQLALADELTREEIEFARTGLDLMDSKGKILPCFTNFGRYFPLPENMEDKIYIEYFTNPEHRVTIHIATRLDGKRIVKAEPMRNVCYGIFVKEIVLFSQETIDYVISDDDGVNVISAERKTLTGPEKSDGNSKSRFNSINNIINARKAEDRSKAIELLNDYVKREFAISQLFREI